ncbi:Flagellin protein FlaA [Hyphomicrobiales bacterium]|nr:Flagellin protein FlaA [Hyphomicrobiales bacterium]CAH1700136.1 Flagellin protein FlaA [Hyphomicrobiales bacterium]CAI0343898.1 Flagellin [Hyphomicrobiales bacterium]
MVVPRRHPAAVRVEIAMSNVVLTASVRQSLLSLQRTSEQQAIIGNRLATGKKVNSALDNPSNFFTSESLQNRASDLNRLLDQMGLAVKTVEAADAGITGIKKLVETAQGLARQARQSADAPTRAALATQYNTIMTQIDQLSADSGYNGTNLIAGTPDNLDVIFNEDGSNSLSITGAALDTTGLPLADATNSWVGNTDIDAALTEMDAALLKLRAQASTFGANLAIVKNRQDFTKNMTLALTTGADGLVLADPNEEGASLLALNTRQQLSQTTLSLANQADQAVLRLFG